MKIQRLKIDHWRGVTSSEVEFGDGVTIVAGPNEVGKSSLIEALRFLFRFPDSSSHGDIKAVQPVHADESPTVELDAELGDQTIRYTKRFKKAGRSGETTLRIEAPGRNAEQLTGRDAHDRAEALLGEDIDVALWEALQLEQGTGISQASLQGKRGLQEALDKAAGTDSVLSADDALLIDRAEQAYLQYFTAKGRPKGQLGSLPDAIGATIRQKVEITKRLDEVQAAADRHGVLSRQLVGMQANLPALRDQSEKAAQDLEAARKLEAKHAKAALGAKTLESQQAEATKKQEERQAWRDAIRQSTDAVLADEKHLKRVQGELLDLNQCLATTEQAQLEQKVQREQATVKARIYRLAIERSGLQQQLETLQSTLNQVHVIDGKLLAEQALVDGISLQDSDLITLRALERKVIEAEAAALAVTPTLQVTAQQALDLNISGESVHLTSGEVREEPATSAFVLELPGVLTVGISTTLEIKESQAATDEARRAFNAALSERHVGSLARAQQLISDKDKGVARINDLKAQRGVWLENQKVDDLRASVSALSAKIFAIDGALAGQDLPDEERAVRDELVAAERVIAEVQEALDQGASVTAALGVQINTLDHDVKTISARIQGHKTSILEAEAKLKNALAEIADDDLAQRLQVGARELLVAHNELTRIVEALKAADPASAALLADNADAALERQTQEISQTRIILGQLEGELVQAHREGLFDRLSEIEAKVSALEEERRRVERRAKAAQRLWMVLNDHRAAASQRYVRPLKEKIDALGRLVFNASFSVDIGADLSIENRSLDDVTVPFDSLSGGAREQLGILARLAASQIVGEHSRVPLLMDDTLGFTDDDRLTRMGAAIASVARNNQIVVLTCMPGRFTYIGNAKTVLL